MSACSEVLFLAWLLLMDGIVMERIEAASTAQSTRKNSQHLKKSATDDGSICTTDGIDYVLFPDRSRLDEANRKRYGKEAAFEKVAMGFCQTQCNLVCAIENLPLCAVDEITGLQRSFNNPCEMSRDACLNNIAWKLQARGPCSTIQHQTKPTLIEPKSKTTEKSRKPAACINVFNPVCAIFAGVKSTFNNECLVNAENVQTGNDWTIFSHGVCAEDYGSFGYNDERIKYNNIRSFGKNIYHGKHSEAERYYDDMTYIYTPPIVQTEYVDDAFAEMMAQSGNYNQQHFHQPLSTQTVHDHVRPSIRYIDNHNEFGRVIRCKYGSEPICGTFKNRYRTFDNVCELMLRNILLNQTWTTAYAGNCIKNSCLRVCTKEYAPICVSKNGVNLTISNACYLDMKQCRDPQSTWKILEKGECANQIWPAVVSKTATNSLLPTRKHEPTELGSKIDKINYPTSTASAISMFKNKHTKTAIAPPTTTPKAATQTTTTTTLAPATTTPTTTASQSIKSLKFVIQKSKTTPKHYISLTTSEATKTTTPITPSPYHSTTKTLLKTYVISAKTAPVFSTRTSIYGSNRNSAIMRLVKAKAFSLPKYPLARGFSRLTST